MSAIGKLGIVRLAVVALVVTALALLAQPPPQALATVRSCSSSTPVVSRPALRLGDTGSCVKVLQNILLGKGYSIGSSYATGTFGSGTLGAVRRYQQSRLYLDIDGVVGPYTWHALVDGARGYDVRSGPNTSSRVVLSYDDCPLSLSSFRAAVLGAQQLGIALVLSPTGACLQTGRFDVAYARAHGHYVINHTITHPDLTTLSRAGVIAQLGPPGVVTSYGRPPYGSYDFTVRDAYAAKAMRMWLWDVDTNDWRGRTQSQVVGYVIGYSHSGDTVLMHMNWHAFNSSAMAAMKAGLAHKGLGVCRNPGPTTPAYPHVITC